MTPSEHAAAKLLRERLVLHQKIEHRAPKALGMLEKLRQAVIRDENVFAVLMDAVRVCSLGQITQATFEVGGEYRRSM